MQGKGRRLDQIKKHSVFYLFLLPGVISAFIFNYIPMGGIIMAFQDYRPQDGWLHSDWAGLKHFIDFLTDPDFYRALRNTLGINFLMILIGFPLPIIFSLALHEMRSEKFKRVVQTITYLAN